MVEKMNVVYSKDLLLMGGLVILLCLFSPLASLAAGLEGSEAGREGYEVATAADEMLLFFEKEDLIIGPTRHLQTLKKAPAIATVFTARDIRNMGARDIMDILKRVPGIGITKNFYGLNEIEVRGIIGFRSEKVLFMIDGVSVNSLSGGATWTYDNLSVDNIKRVEVIRSPGSALYGTDAFSAVVNIITKNSADMDGVTLSAAGGSFNTKKYNFQAGRRFGDLGAALSMDYLTTDGDKNRIESDSIGNSGDAEDFDRRFDAQLRLSYKDFALNSRYVTRKKGPYLGPTQAVNNDSKAMADDLFTELSYRSHLLDDTLDVTIKAYYRHFDIEARWELFPEGSVFPFGAFPNGMLAMPKSSERYYGTELLLDYKLGDNNLLTVGTSMEKKEQTDVQRITNFNPLTNVPLGGMTNVSAWANFNQEKDRYVKALYLQNIWDVTDDLSVTLGIRHDHYSGFGGTTNPRAAVVWQFKKRWDMKLMYATAFRAPSFSELYFINNPAVLGNPDLEPERLETYEVSLGHTHREGTSARVSWFHNSFRDKIDTVLNPGPSILIFENTGGARIWGIEAELERALFKNRSRVYANYTFQNAEDTDTNRRLANVARHKGNVGADIAFARYFKANLNVFWSGERPRASGDSRDGLAAYSLVDATIIARNFYKGLELRLSGHNILDEKYEDPSDITVPGDFPRDGASVMAEATYRF